MWKYLSSHAVLEFYKIRNGNRHFKTVTQMISPSFWGRLYQRSNVSQNCSVKKLCIIVNLLKKVFLHRGIQTSSKILGYLLISQLPYETILTLGRILSQLSKINIFFFLCQYFPIEEGSLYLIPPSPKIRVLLITFMLKSFMTYISWNERMKHPAKKSLII